jgi:hypothetical protein
LKASRRVLTKARKLLQGKRSRADPERRFPGLQSKIAELEGRASLLLLTWAATAALEKRDFAKAGQLMKASTKSVSAPDREALIGHLNATVLPRYQREWTTHGIRRSFRYWSDDEIAHYLRFGLSIAADLNGLTPNVCLGYGGVLGLIRDGRLIPHDDDLDLLITLPRAAISDFAAGVTRTRTFLEDLGYSVRSHKSHLHVWRRGEAVVDVFVGIEEPPYSIWHPGPRRAIRTADVFPPATFSYLGIDVPIPNSREHYLAQVYGETWRIPQQLFRHKMGVLASEDMPSQAGAGPVIEPSQPA